MRSWVADHSLSFARASIGSFPYDTSNTLNPARRNLSVRTHRFCPAVYGGTFNPPPYLFIEFERGPGSGVDQHTIPSCMTESSLSMRYPVLIWANYMTKPFPICGRCGRTGYRMVDVSTRTHCAFFINIIIFLFSIPTPTSRYFIISQVISKEFWTKHNCFSHPIIWYNYLIFLHRWQNNFHILLKWVL